MTSKINTFNEKKNIKFYSNFEKINVENYNMQV